MQVRTFAYFLQVCPNQQNIEQLRTRIPDIDNINDHREFVLAYRKRRNGVNQGQGRQVPSFKGIGRFRLPDGKEVKFQEIRHHLLTSGSKLQAFLCQSLFPETIPDKALKEETGHSRRAFDEVFCSFLPPGIKKQRIMSFEATLLAVLSYYRQGSSFRTLAFTVDSSVIFN